MYTSILSSLPHSININAASSSRGRRLAASVLFAITLAASSASAQILTAQQVTGFNEDLIANGTSTVSASTTKGFDRGQPVHAFYSADFVSSVTGAAPEGSGLPSSGLIVGENGNSYQLADYGGLNALVLRPDSYDSGQPGTSSGTLAFVNPGAFAQVSFLGTSANGNSTVNYKLNFQDGGSSVSGSVEFYDWFANRNGFVSGFGRINRSTDVFDYSAGNPRFFEHTIELAVADQSRVLTSIEFEFASGGANSRAAIFAVSAIPEPRVYALAVGLMVLGLALVRLRRA